MRVQPRRIKQGVKTLVPCVAINVLQHYVSDSNTDYPPGWSDRKRQHDDLKSYYKRPSARKHYEETLGITGTYIPRKHPEEPDWK